MKKLLILLCTIFFVVFGNAQKLRDDVEFIKPEKWETSLKPDTLYFVISPIVEATRCAPNTTLGKSGFYAYLNGDAGKKLLNRCLSTMNIDTFNSEIITNDSLFHALKSEEFSTFYIKTVKQNGEYVQNVLAQDQPFFREQKTPYTEKKPKVYVEYFSKIKDSDFMNFRVFVKR